MFLLFAAYFSIRVWSDTYAMLLQSMNELKPLWLIVPFQATLSFGLQWYLAGKFKIYGILIGLIISFILTVVIFLPIFYRKKVKELRYV
ncbi:polysaccharide biosynthesis C-terminal domain-containing protein [Xenorhabdus siamensis]|uniref:polysaccharide biosynthesis C-terminal domain-containing protein n=1 Tax=Xenorhabdus siamensis TaxID=3136254 RepID=UPI003BF60079